MDFKRIEEILKQYRKGKYSLDNVIEELKIFPFADLVHSKIDHHRTLRFGFPEVVYSEGKKIEHLKDIISELNRKYKNFIATRMSAEQANKILKEFPDLVYYPEARILTSEKIKRKKKKEVAVLCAGTSDIPVAEEAAITAEILGIGVERIYDVGISGLHRLFPFLNKIYRCKILIVVAGMEGALPSVVSGLTGKPVIGVPSSIGYGTSIKGLSALLTMLNSCSPIVVVNIDNGFGAAFFAYLVIRK